MPSLRALLLPVGIIYLVYSGVLIALFPLPEGSSLNLVLIAVASGLLRVTAVVIMLYSLRKEEVSQVVPIVYTSPIFVAIMAGPILGETLHYLKWLAVIIVVAGGVMVSASQRRSGSVTWLNKPLLLLFTSSLLLATADITTKYALAYLSFWHLFWISTLCIGGVFLLMSSRSDVLVQLKGMPQRYRTLALLVFNEALAPVGMLLIFWALERGPVSLVSTIASSRPVFVFLFAYILSHVSPAFIEWRIYSKSILALRLAATALIVGGIAIIHLT